MIVTRRLALVCFACGSISSVLTVIPGRAVTTTWPVELVTTRLATKFSLGLATKFTTGLALKFTTRLAEFRLATGSVALSLRAWGVM